MVETKFKHTDIGLIPEDWETRYVKEFTDCTAGGTPSTKVDGYWGGDIPWMNSGELNKRKIYYTQNFITKRGLENSSTKIIPKNCVLIGLAGQGKTRGTVAINKIELSINQSIGVFYPNSIFNYNYLFYNLQKRYNELRLLSSGDGGRGGLNLNILKNLVIPLPPLPEQQAIAEVLSDTDNWIESLEKLIAKKQLIKQGAMQQLLTPKEDWEVRKLEEVCEITGAGVDKKINKNESSVTLLNYLDVYRRDYIFKSELNHIVTAPNSKIQQCNIKKGDVLITPSSELSDDIGVTALAMEDMDGVVYSYHLYRIRFKMKIDWKFGLFIFKNRLFLNQAEKFAEGSGKRYVISLSKIRDFDISIPKSLSEQNRIANILSDMDTEIETLKQKLAKTKQIKQGLMQELLTGRIRLA
ncbi:restriction endonuclease subunit S [Elizabethkingia anophelis]|uniref:restriction endonuclease subunit S n=1 Tax=Elizabethkingia anophelis TaxID=1117645 RepID=UPI0011EB3343|nr:restriction endonuclease subunit S [Elizabethkingia anophelis]TYT29557.1 restriction endonuclease subunit S [Elizabethkingia anophelis]UKY90914.1 restriction endonuclease subunit S [Elizabethkingia anophelis]UKY98083.1 restriction endonuclease subunit S [Elizabethkingia anophelis]